eukprot:13853257-Ditylum_brightwellii.AAC.1
MEGGLYEQKAWRIAVCMVPKWRTNPTRIWHKKCKVYIKCHAPTPDEMNEIPIHWIDCHVEDLEIDNSTKPMHRDPVQRADPILLPNTSVDIEPEMISMGTVEMNPDPKSEQVTIDVQDPMESNLSPDSNILNDGLDPPSDE